MRLTRTRIALAAGLLAAVSLLVFRAYEGRATENRLSAIASELAGRDVRVECQGAVGAAVDVSTESGSVWFYEDGRPADVATLKRDVCAELVAFARGHGGERFECLEGAAACEFDALKGLHALQTLAHEAWHLAGERSESVAECYALQTVELVAKRLGAAQTRAQAAARAVFGELYPRMPSAYRSLDCRDGGPLDLRPDSPAWP